MARDWSTLRRQADDQCGLLTRRQCLSSGLTDGFIAHRLGTGRWAQAHPGVYLTLPGRADWMVRAMAAFLYAGSYAGARVAFVGPSAQYLWAQLPDPPRTIDLAVPHTRRVAPIPGAALVRRRDFDSVVDDLAYPWRTRTAVTVVDVAVAGSEDAALATVARAVQQCHVTAGQLRSELDRRGPCRHGGLLREVLADVEEGAESTAELRYIRDVERAHALPAGQRQAASRTGAARRHDNRYPAYRVVVEVDGRLGHESWQDRVRDGQRDRQVLPSQGVTLRVYWPDVTLTPCATAVEIGAALSAGGWMDRPRRCRRPGCTVPVPDRERSWGG